jgi:hypothetical protein
MKGADEKVLPRRDKKISDCTLCVDRAINKLRLDELYMQYKLN